MLRAKILIAAILCMACAWAQKDVDVKSLSFSENIAVPVPRNKGIADLRSHIKAIEASLIRKDYASALERNGEVVVATIPASALFAPNATQITPGTEGLLEPFAQYMRYPTMYKIIVAVYADDTGDDQYARALTDARAQAILQALCAKAAAKGESVAAYGLGKEKYVAPNTSIEGRAANRRVEIRIMPNWQMLDMASSGKLKNK